MATPNNFRANVTETNTSKTDWQRIFAITALLFSASIVYGQEPETPQEPNAVGEQPATLELWVGFGYSDNVRREEDSEDGTYQSVGVVTNLVKNRERLNAGLATDIQFRQYSIDGLDDQVFGNVDGFLHIGLVPDRVTWIVDDNFGQGRTDPFAAAGPLNSQSINAFTTGPLIELPLGPRNELALSAMYQDYRHEFTEEIDSETITYDLSLMRQINTVTAVGVVADSRDIDYPELAETYTIRGAVVRYERDFSSGGVSAEIGRNELEVGDTTTSGPRARLTWRRDVGPRSNWSISASQEFTDAGAFFAFSANEGLVAGREDVLLSPSPLEQQRVEMLYEFTTPKTLIAIGAAVSEESFETDSTLDNDSSIVRMSISRELSQRTSMTLIAEQVDRDFHSNDEDTGDRFISLMVDHRLARKWTLQLDARSYTRRDAGVFDERSVELRLRYEPTAR